MARGTKGPGKRFLLKFFPQRTMRFTVNVGEKLAIAMAEAVVNKLNHFYCIWFLHDLDDSFEFLEEHVHEWRLPEDLVNELKHHDPNDREILGRVHKIEQFRPTGI